MGYTVRQHNQEEFLIKSSRWQSVSKIAKKEWTGG